MSTVPAPPRSPAVAPVIDYEPPARATVARRTAHAPASSRSARPRRIHRESGPARLPAMRHPPRCMQRHGSATRHCDGFWKSWISVGRQRICTHCSPPVSPTRCWRHVRRHHPAGSNRPSCSECGCSRSIRPKQPVRWRFSAPTDAVGAPTHWPAGSNRSPEPATVSPGRSSPCTSADMRDRRRGSQPLRGVLGSREPRPSRRAASRRSRRVPGAAACRSRLRRTWAEPSSSGPE